MATKSNRSGRVLNAAAGTVAKHPVTQKQEDTAAVREAKAITDIRRGGESSLAKEYGQKIGEETFAEFDTIVNATEYLNICGLNMAEHIRATFTLKEIAAMPVVNTNKKAEENYKGNNPDYTVIKDGKKTKRVSFFDTMLASTSWVINLNKIIDDLSAVVGGKDGYSKLADAEGNKYISLYVNPAEQKAALAKYRKRLTQAQAKWRTGMRVVQQEARLEELVGEHIAFALTKDAKGNVIPGPSPIYLEANVPKGTARPYDNFSVTSFLSLDIQAAVDSRLSDTAKATWDALLETLSNDEPESEADADNIVIGNEKAFETGMASMLAFCQDHSEVLLKMVQRINGAKELDDVKSLAITIGELANELGAMKKHIQKRYEKAIMLESAKAGTLDQRSTEDAIAS